MKIILKHILRNIWEKKGRSLLIILALTVATTVFTLNLTLPDEILLKVHETMRSVYGDFDISMTSVEEFSVDDVWLGDEKIEYTGMVFTDVLIDDEPASIYGMDIEVARGMHMLGTDVDLLENNEVIVSKSDAEKYEYEVGDTFTAVYEEKEFEFVIAQIVEDKGLNSLTVEFPMFMANLDFVAGIKGLEEGKVDELAINILDDDNLKAYIEELSENNENFNVQALTDIDTLREQTSFISYLMVMIFVMATIMIMFVVSSLNKIIIAERMPVIGTFRSIGATKGKMNMILILENAVYGLIGGIIGAFAGYGINSNVAGLFITTNGVSLTKETSHIDVKMFVLGVAFSVLLQVVISVKAIMKANKKPIKDIIFDVQSSRYRVMKHRVVWGVILLLASIIMDALLKDTNIVLTIVAIVLLITGSAMLVPFILQQVSKAFAVLFKKLGWSTATVASRNIGYNKMIVTSSRVVVVALSLMLAIVTVSSSITNLFQSFRLMVDDYDIVIQNVTKEEEEYEKLLELDGVTHIQYLHCYYDDRITYNDGKEFHTIPSFIGLEESIKYIKEYNVKIGDLEYDEVLLDEVFAEKSDIEIGDTLNVNLPSVNKEIELKVVGTVNSAYFTTSRNVIIMNYDNYIENVYQTPMQVQLKVEDGTDLDELKEQIDDTMKELNLKIQTVDEYITEQEESTASIMSIFYVVIGLAVILSFIGIINNQIIGFIQRRKEIAVLNSTCMSKGQIKKMLFFETVLANLISSVVAVIVGFMATGMIDSFMKGMEMYVEVEYSIATAVSFVAVIFAILLLTLLSPMKKLKKMNIVNEIKYE
ncbi:MAG: FtsX-like permease family protein [Lachnospiraceae bacterium]|nr:FtsX-like permease family protein [Lachnospiraceae bacterium]